MQVSAKTGTCLAGTSYGILLEDQAFAGYIATKGGKHLVYETIASNAPVTDLSDVIQVFQDEGTASAILWRDY